MRKRNLFLIILLMVMVIPTVGMATVSQSTHDEAKALQDRENAVKKCHTDFLVCKKNAKKAKKARRKIKLLKRGATGMKLLKLRALDGQWKVYSDKNQRQMLVLQKAGRKLCEGISRKHQAACLMMLTAKEKEITTRDQQKNVGLTARNKAFLDTAAFMHTRCKDGKDASGPTLNCAKGNNMPSGKVKLKVLRNGELSKEVYEFTPTKPVPAPVVAAPINRWAPVKPAVVGTPDNGFTPPKGWSTGTKYAVGGGTGMVLVTTAALAIFGRKDKVTVNKKTGKPVDFKPGNIEQVGAVGAGTGLGLGLFATWLLNR